MAKTKLSPNHKYDKINLHFDRKGNLESFNTWHRVNGKFIHIAQVFKGESEGYYTDGKKETK